MPRQRRTGAIGQQGESVIEALTHFVYRHRAQPWRGEFDCKRNAVKAQTD
jgi:hypothetical protein